MSFRRYAVTALEVDPPFAGSVAAASSASYWLPRPLRSTHTDIIDL